MKNAIPPQIIGSPFAKSGNEKCGVSLALEKRRKRRDHHEVYVSSILGGEYGFMLSDTLWKRGFQSDNDRVQRAAVVGLPLVRSSPPPLRRMRWLARLMNSACWGDVVDVLRFLAIQRNADDILGVEVEFLEVDLPHSAVVHRVIL